MVIRIIAENPKDEGYHETVSCPSFNLSTVKTISNMKYVLKGLELGLKAIAIQEAKIRKEGLPVAK